MIDINFEIHDLNAASFFYYFPPPEISFFNRSISLFILYTGLQILRNNNRSTFPFS